MYTDLVAELMELDNCSLTERFRELELQRRRIEAEMTAVVSVANARCVHGDDGHGSIKGWMRANANWSGSDVSTRRRAVELFETCPTAGDALLAGHIGGAQVSELARARSNPRCGDDIVHVLDALLDSAEHLSFEGFRTVVRHWEHRADEDGVLADAEANQANRKASVLEIDGRVDVRATGGAPVDTAMMLGIFEKFIDAEFHLDAAARRERYGPNVPASLLPRTDAQRRFDALLKIFTTAASMPADARGPSFVVNLVCDLPTFDILLARHRLIPVDDALPPIDLADALCRTDSGVPIPPEHILQAALLGQVRRVVVDNDGVVLDMGRKRRLFTGAARVAAKLMATHCDHPGCRVGTHYADVDHLLEWQRDGGSTDVGNSTVRCRSHDRAKHRLGLIDRRAKSGQVVTFRRDGAPMLPVGCRLPEFENDDPEAPDNVVNPDAGPGDLRLVLVEERCRIAKRLAGDLLRQLHMETVA